MSSSGGFRPPGWSQPQLTSLTANLPTAPSSSVSHNVTFDDQSINSGSTQQAAPTKPTTYFFDAVMHVDHDQELVATKHPTQSGASITDHAYLLPAAVSLEVLMSDAMDSYQTGQWTGASTKSVNFYQTMLQLQALRIPITVTTRLNTYTNMVLTSIRASDDVRTLHGFRGSLRFEQIIVGTVNSSQSNPVSARPNQTAATNPGSIQPVTPGQNLDPFFVPSLGSWSSNPVGAAPSN